MTAPKTAVIMQPTYLPWIGYFDLMDQADIFVYLDTVQFDKRSWQQRNRIRNRAGEILLSVPVLSKGRFDQKIQDVELLGDGFNEKHRMSVRTCYAGAPFFGEWMPGLEKLYAEPPKLLAEWNIRFIEFFKERLGLKCRTLRASGLRATGKRVELLDGICRELGATRYLSPLGSKEYISADNRFAESGIELEFQHYEHPVYKQSAGEFIPHLSIVDLAMNCGPESLRVIRSGRKTSWSLAEAPEAV